jgi:hypothetical protein
MLPTLTLLSALSAFSPADSVAGAWQFKMEVGGTDYTEVCTFKQAGAVLSGTCLGDSGKPYPLTGELKDGKLTFQHGGDYQGQEITIIYSGSLAAPAKIEGTLNVKPFDAAGTFTAAPAPAGATAPAAAPATAKP